MMVVSSEKSLIFFHTLSVFSSRSFQIYYRMLIHLAIASAKEEAQTFFLPASNIKYNADMHILAVASVISQNELEKHQHISYLPKKLK